MLHLHHDRLGHQSLGCGAAFQHPDPWLLQSSVTPLQSLVTPLRMVLAVTRNLNHEQVRRGTGPYVANGPRRSQDSLNTFVNAEGVANEDRQ